MTTQKTILCVDDEESILASFKRLLRKENFTLLTASNGVDALTILEKQPVQLVLSDYRMPKMNGVEFLQRVKENHPQSVRVILSGYADTAAVLEAINKGEIYRFLTKPWNDDELKIHIHQCLEHYDLLEQNRELLQKLQEKNQELERLNLDLENRVIERTTYLLISQRILDGLPVPVLGINLDGTLVFANQAIRKVYPILEELKFGNSVCAILTKEMESEIKHCLDGKVREQFPLIELCGKKVWLRAIPVREAQSLTGCILVFDNISLPSP